jgi:hypothetical protein
MNKKRKENKIHKLINYNKIILLYLDIKKGSYRKIKMKKMILIK